MSVATSRMMWRVVNAAAIMGVVGLSSCDRPEPPTGPPAARSAVAGPPSGPFYYHRGEPVALEADPSKIVVVAATPNADPTAAVQSTLEPFGATVARAERLAQRRDHYTYDITGATAPALDALEALREHPDLTFAAPAYVTSETRDTLVLVNEVAVDFADGVTNTTVDSLVSAIGARIVRPPIPRYGFFQYRLAYPHGSDPLEVAAELDRHPLVDWADPNKIGSLDPSLGSPADPYYSLQYYFENANGIDINIESAWAITLGEGIPSAGGIWVAVTDDGVDADHPDFGGQVQTGYAWDAIVGDHAAAADPYPGDSHGTNVTGLILGQHNNSEGVAGGAPEVNLVPIRIYSSDPNLGLAADADVGDAIRWAWYWTDSDVLSNSWRWPHTSNAITDAINDGVAQGRDGAGATIVFAAGNNANRDGGDYGQVEYPGRLASVIAVGAIDRFGEPADYTPRGSELDIVALSGHEAHRPGVECDTRGDVVTTELSGADGCNDGPNDDQDYTENFTGTSAAAPQVAIAAALMYSADPSLTDGEVKGRLYDTADYWGSSLDFGAGKLDIGDAMRFEVTIEGPSTVPEDSFCTWTANAQGGDAPYSYEWYRDGSYVGSGDTYEASTGRSDFTLLVDATDSDGTIRSDQLSVTVTRDADPGGDCGA